MKVGESTRTPESRCTNCGKQIDAATVVTDDPAHLTVAPSPGDFTVCIACGHVMFFADDLALRDPTAEDIKIVAGDPRILAIQRARNPDPSTRRLAEIIAKACKP
jgi:hypothetical protein